MRRAALGIPLVTPMSAASLFLLVSNVRVAEIVPILFFWLIIYAASGPLGRIDIVFGGSIRFSTAAFRSGEYPKSSSYPAHLRNRGKVEQRTTSLTQGALTLASGEVPLMVGLLLFLPETWTGDPDGMARARVPEDRQIALSKPEIDRVRATGIRFGCVLADAGYGSSGPFRHALSARGLAWAPPQISPSGIRPLPGVAYRKVMRPASAGGHSP